MLLLVEWLSFIINLLVKSFYLIQGVVKWFICSSLNWTFPPMLPYFDCVCYMTFSAASLSLESVPFVSASIAVCRWFDLSYAFFFFFVLRLSCLIFVRTAVTAQNVTNALLPAASTLRLSLN